MTIKVQLFSIVLYISPDLFFFFLKSTLLILAIPVVTPVDPCEPSPCGPYSQCRVVNGHAVCSCQANYIGTPPTCRPECMISADCAQDKACINQKCQDPCPGTCGINARCQVVNHNPICSCSPGFTGDPFIRCVQEQSKPSSFIFSFHKFTIKLFVLFFSTLKLSRTN